MIKNLLFDLGGVIMNLDRMRAVRSLEKLGMRDASVILGEYAQKGPFGALESGSIGIDEWHRQMASYIDCNVDYNDIDSAFISFLDGIPAHRLKSLESLHENFGIYLLSNTNELMWETEIKRQFRQLGKDIEYYFDGIVTSYEAKAMKPDAAIFVHAAQKLGIKPEETLFLDDSQTNCDAAEALGWKTLHVAPGREFTELLDEYFSDGSKGSKTVENTKDVKVEKAAGPVVAVGMFDGVHSGHAFLIKNLVNMAREMDTEAVVVTFSNHPMSVINPEKTPKLLSSSGQKTELLKKLGVDRVITLDFDKNLCCLTAAEFAHEYLVDRLNARLLLIGYDNGFGCDRLRGLDSFRHALADVGIKVMGCDKFKDFDVSSSKIRLALEKGNIAEVNHMLGHGFEISGKVTHGKELGRELGFPTANIDVSADMALPANGVYAGYVSNGPECVTNRPAMINIGTAPTVNVDKGVNTVEAHIIMDSPNPGPDLYGKNLSLVIVERLRDEHKFNDLAELKAALDNDRANTIRIFNSKE